MSVGEKKDMDVFTSLKQKLRNFGIVVYAQEGFSQGTYSKILKKSGALNQSAIHYHFNGKKGFVESIYQDILIDVRSIVSEKITEYIGEHIEHPSDAYVKKLRSKAFYYIMSSDDNKCSFLKQVASHPIFYTICTDEERATIYRSAAMLIDKKS